MSSVEVNRGFRCSLESLLTHLSDLKPSSHRSHCPLDQLEAQECVRLQAQHAGCASVSVRLYVHTPTRSMKPDTPAPEERDPPDNPTKAQLPTVKLSILWPADRGILNNFPHLYCYSSAPCLTLPSIMEWKAWLRITVSPEAAAAAEHRQLDWLENSPGMTPVIKVIKFVTS